MELDLRGLSAVPGAKREVSCWCFSASLCHFRRLHRVYWRDSFCRWDEVRGLRSNLAVHFLNHLLEVILAHLDDFKFALGIFHRITGVRGIDHDG